MRMIGAYRWTHSSGRFCERLEAAGPDAVVSLRPLSLINATMEGHNAEEY